MEEHILQLGHDVILAENGKEAYQLLKKRRDEIDIVLLDREMPELDGMELVALMKNNQYLHRKPIIMATGLDRPEHIKQGIDAGVFFYLTKPYEEKILRSVLSSAIREIDSQNTLKTELLKHKGSFKLLNAATFSVKLLPMQRMWLLFWRIVTRIPSACCLVWLSW